MVSITRYHDISTGHKVWRHEGKCRNLHGHNYRIHFTVAPIDDVTLDSTGRVVDFSVVKERLCEWLEVRWDHKFLVFSRDPALELLSKLDPDGVVEVPFNPTAENMARYLVDVVGPAELKGTGTRLVSCTIDETRKCSATYEAERS